jgi:HlyD family secretion protein
MTRIRAALVAAVVLLGAVIGLVMWPRGARTEKMERELRTAQVEPADFYVAVRVVGVLEAAQTHPVVCMAGGGGGRGRGPGGAKIVWKLDDGERVEEGDIILKLDAAEAQEEVGNLDAEVADAEEDLRKAEADGQKRVENARAGLEKAQEAFALVKTQNQAALEQAKAEMDYQEKELDVARGQLEKRKGLAEEKLIALTEVEAAEDEERQRQFAWERAQRMYAQSEQDVARIARLRAMDIEKAELELDQAVTSLADSVSTARRGLDATRVRSEDAQSQLEATEVKAPAAGMLLLERNWRQEPLRVGDDVREGQRVANVIDPAEMDVRCDIGESDIERVQKGQQARVLVPALGGLALRGTVEAIDNLARERQWWEGGVAGKKVFAASIGLSERDERLRPGMGATVEIQLRHVNEGVAVPIEAVFEVGGRQVVYRSEGERYRAVPVTVTARNELLAAVKGELKAGDVVACERPPALAVTEVEKPK